ncbi:sensor histidine kinase [Rhodococcus spongiicola]|uniref:histidine kinase n=1 Tax=Rhodococcus spongiicola TaxID=2487352 RepID=A0A438B6C2_9NOCA|nr:sensor histidine kinase [Rhodococcus spongiicola]RVW06493.1 sensor histidine kinase [Rhodococcus spongiicola]
MSLARRLLILQMVVLGVVVAALSVLTILDERRDSDAATRRHVSSIAEAIALSESTIAALRSPDPSSVLQPEVEQIRVATGTDFIVVMAPDRTRYTHPNPALIGQHSEGHIERALAGETFTETFTGSLGPSIRAVAPVQADGQVLGLVSVGVTRERIGEEFAEGWPALLGILAVGVAVATFGSLLVSRHLRRQTLGLDPEELRRLYEHNDAVLRSIGEGLIMFGRDRDGRVRVDVVNDKARRLLWLPDGPVTLYQLPETLQRIASDSDSEEVQDEVHVTADRVLVVGHAPVLWEGRRIGTVVTLRDHTELQRALGELDSARNVAESLRAQAHEYANRLHTIVTMVELGRGDDAVSFAAAELTTSQQLIDRLTTAVHEPAIAALLLGKVTEAAQQGVEFTVTEDTALGPVRVLSPLEVVTVVGNLVDNAIDAARSGSDENPWVEVTVAEEDSVLVVRVADSGPGMDPDTLELATTRGYSTKQVDGRPARQRGLGLALVAQVVARHGGRLRTEPSLASMLVVEIPLPNEPRGIDDGEDPDR